MFFLPQLIDESFQNRIDIKRKNPYLNNKRKLIHVYHFLENHVYLNRR